MRNEQERELAQYSLQCALQQAQISGGATSDTIIKVAEKYFAFVSGVDVDEAKATLDAVRAVVERVA